MIHSLRVIYGDTDMMGVVYYGNYLRYFESARSAWFRDIGRSYRDLEALGIGFPVVEAHCRYRRPARYEDVLDIDVRITELKGASLRFAYRIRKDGEDIASGYTVHACTDGTGRPVPIPAELRDAIGIEAEP
jgi:acyl-CoA thioester hydrolase